SRKKAPSLPEDFSPPKLEESIDTIYYTPDDALLDSWTAPRKEKIVTSQIFYKPGLLAIARITFETTRADLYQQHDTVRVITFPETAKMPNWDDTLIKTWNQARVRLNPDSDSNFLYDSSHDFSPEKFEQLNEDFLQHLVSTEVLELEFNPYLKLYRKLDESNESFSARCLDGIRKEHEQEVKNLEDTLQRQTDRLTEKLEREVREIGAEQLEAHSSGTFSPAPKKSPSPHSQEEELQDSIVTIDDINKQLAELEAEKKHKSEEMQENLHKLAEERERDLLRLNRGDIQILRLALIWLPYTQFVIQEGENRRLELIQSF